MPVALAIRKTGFSKNAGNPESTRERSWLKTASNERQPPRQEMADGKPESVFRVVRDLTFRARTKNLNDDDKNILERALSLLRSEMALALSVRPEQAEQELQKRLHPLEVAVT